MATLRERPDRRARQRVDLRDLLDLIAEERHPDRPLLLVRGKDLHHVAPHAERTSREIVVVPLVLDVHQTAEQIVPVDLGSRLDRDQAAPGIPAGSQVVDAGDGRHDDRVPPGQDRAGGRVAHLVDLVVDPGVFLDVRVRGRDVRLRLVVVVVADEVLHGVLGKEDS